MDEIETGPLNLERLREDYLIFLHAIVLDFQGDLLEDQVDALHKEIDQLDLAFPGELLLNLAWVHLPSFGKVFDKVLSTGAFDSAGGYPELIPFVDTVFSSCHPEGFQAYVEQCGTDDLNPNLVFLVRQLLYFYKKFKVEWEPGADIRAAEEFWAIEDTIREPHHPDLFGAMPCLTEFAPQQPPAYGQGWSPANKEIFDLLSLAQWFCDRFSSHIPIWDWEQYAPRHGPGAVSDLPSSGDKYSFPNFSEVISVVFPAEYFCQVNFDGVFDVCLTTSKPAAKLAAVPKTYIKPRLIASEPVVHQWFQQALMKQLREHMHPLLRKVVSFQDQVPSQDLARKFSATGEGVTIDLSAASDRLSLFVVQCFFRRNPPLLDLLERTRSDRIVDAIRGEVDARPIRKFAAMGSGVTFPVQTYVYAACCFAAVTYARGWQYRSYRSWQRALERVCSDIRVFGDDIAVPEDASQHLVLLLETLGLKVNRDKTHVSGYFRESCGMDAYRGFDVTPAYVSHPSPADYPNRSREEISFVAYIEQSNNAHRKGLWHLADAMKGRLSENLAWMVPISHERLGVVSLYTFTHGTTAARTRYNRQLHRYETRGLSLRGTRKISKRDTLVDLLQYFTERNDRQLDHHQMVELLQTVGVVRGIRTRLLFGWSDARCSYNPRRSWSAVT